MDPEESPRELPQVGDDPTWTPEVEGLLGDWRNRVYAAQSAHYSAADLFRVLNYLLGAPGDLFAIRRDIEQLLSLPVETRGKPKECLDGIRKEMNRASQDSPELSGRQWRRQAKRFKLREPTSPM
jgi:hypothetical protein